MAVHDKGVHLMTRAERTTLCMNDGKARCIVHIHVVAVLPKMYQTSAAFFAYIAAMCMYM